MEKKTYTTVEAAAEIGVTRQTLYLWINARMVAAPKPIVLGNRSMRLWTKSDIERVRKFKGTLKSGAKPKANREPKR
jgi:predicted DNA-binding transcriptional regulator AlpA